MNNEVFSVFITGVGGQGILLASELLSEVARTAGKDVKKSEVHGMAQRGGSVVGHVRFGAKVASPLITDGEADVILAFEKLEALRHINALKPGGKIIVNEQEIAPAPVAAGLMEYPTDVWGRIVAVSSDAVKVEGAKLAKEAGSIRATNVVLLGALSAFLPFEEKIWHEAIKKRVPPKTIEINIKAFSFGRRAAGG
ncbi:indolepyruvate oxidoreductase subunit beta [bacterium]|nr:MAG: indolepyruvate oxidoreductase subunit beta [bacterium]